MYYKIIIRFSFCDIQNNQGPTKGYQPNLDYKNIPQKHHQKFIVIFQSLKSNMTKASKKSELVSHQTRWEKALTVLS